MTRKNCTRRRLGSPIFGRQTGFTLIELMVTVALGTALMMIAVPSFVTFQRNAQLSDAVSNFISAANTARANAMKQGLNTYLVPTTGTNWKSGWMVFADSNWNQVYNEGVDEVILRQDALGTDITISTPGASSFASGYLLFNGSGYPRLKSGSFGGGTMVMANSTPRSSAIIIDLAGRVRSCKTGTTGCS